MRYRRQTASGDYVFGQGPDDFYVDDPRGVAQAIKTRLLLFVGEYFPDTTVGMPWQTQVLGFNQPETYDTAIRNCISGTEGFQSFDSYATTLDHATRLLTLSARVNTIYSGVPVPINLKLVLTGYGVGGYALRPYGD